MAIQLELQKLVIKDFTEALRNVDEAQMQEIIKKYYATDADWYGPYPFPQVKGVEAIYDTFYKPMLKSFPDMSKNMVHLLGGTCEGDDWVISSGFVVANFKEDFLDIPHTNTVVFIRYAEYYKFVDGKIAESRLFLDILDLIRQAGIRVIPTIGPEIISPGPATRDGVVLYDVDEADGVKTRELIEIMSFQGLPDLRDVEKTWYPDDKTLAVMKRYWHEDMMWYGPCGIGCSKGIVGFEVTHELPWEMTFQLSKDDTIVRIGDGNYATYCGWPYHAQSTHRASKMFGLPATGKSATCNLIDIWRREGDLLIENWVFIDMLLFFKDLDLDILDRVKNKRYLFKA